MPLLRFYVTPGMLSAADKAEIAQFLTPIYARVMPAFFVNIIFNEIAADSFFVAGVPQEGNFVRLVLEHLAVHWEEDKVRAKRFVDLVGEGLRQRFEPRGWNWEFHIIENSRDYWRINSMEPPQVGSEALQYWIKEGKPLPWGHLDGTVRGL